MQEQCTPIDLAPAERILADLGLLKEDSPTGARSTNGALEALIPLLQKLQGEYGYLPVEVLQWVSEQTGIPTNRMYGVITFYSQFYTKPRGRHLIRSCQGTACHVRGGNRVADALTDELGVKEGGTTKDGKYTFEAVQCVGTCFLAPVVMIDNDYYGELTPQSAKKIVRKYK